MLGNLTACGSVTLACRSITLACRSSPSAASFNTPIFGVCPKC